MKAFLKKPSFLKKMKAFFWKTKLFEKNESFFFENPSFLKKNESFFFEKPSFSKKNEVFFEKPIFFKKMLMLAKSFFLQPGKTGREKTSKTKRNSIIFFLPEVCVPQMGFGSTPEPRITKDFYDEYTVPLYGALCKKKVLRDGRGFEQQIALWFFLLLNVERTPNLKIFGEKRYFCWWKNKMFEKQMKVVFSKTQAFWTQN